MKPTVIESIAAEERAAQDKLEAEQRAAREKAAKTYYKLIGDPNHNSDKNRQILRECMAVLGKTLADLESDISSLEHARGHFSEAVKLAGAAEAASRAREAEDHFHKVKKLEMHQAIKDETLRVTQVRREAEEAHRAAANSSQHFFKYLKADPWLEQYFPAVKEQKQFDSWTAEHYFESQASGAVSDAAEPKPAA